MMELVLLLVAVGALTFVQLGKTPPESGKWGQPRYVALEVFLLGVVVYIALRICGAE